jgi:2-polyprenyl-3-methyl-5-hydroxy-6-metoxy-1,4-benzoquinol methylase
MTINSIEALNKINSIAFSYFIAQSYNAAFKLGLFDFLSENYKSVDAVSKSLKIHPETCLKLLAAMENLELVVQKNGQYKNSILGNYIVRDSEFPIRIAQTDNFFYRMWEHLPDALRERSPRFEQAWNMSAQETYGALFEDEKRLREFFELMDSYALPIGSEVAKLVDFSKFSCILDLAGGSGSFSIQIANYHKHLKGIVFELPPVCALTTKMIQENGLQDSFKAVPGNMMTDKFPEGFDVILLSWILHNYSDENCKIILKKCYDSLPSGGMLLVSEKVLNNDNTGSEWGIMMSLQMLLACEPGAKERTHDEYFELLEETGFNIHKFFPIDAPRDLIVAYKNNGSSPTF